MDGFRPGLDEETLMEGIDTHNGCDAYVISILAQMLA